MLRAAIIGCGAIAPVHAHALTQLKDVQLAACADIVFDRADKLAKEYDILSYTTLEELLEKQKVDVVHLCTPHYLHTPMAAYAASHGIHVFTEKPPVIDRLQWSSLCETASKVRVGVCFQNRYNGSIKKIKQMLFDGSLGKVHGARAFVTWNRGLEYYTQSGWRGSLKTEGGGVLINQAIHTLDLLVYLMGKPENISSSLTNHHLQHDIEVEDTVNAYMTFQGAPALLYATTAYCTNSPVYLEMVCENAVVQIEKELLSISWRNGREEKLSYEQELTAAKDYWGAAHTECIGDYYDALLYNRSVPIGIEEVTDSIDAMLTIYGR